MHCTKSLEQQKRQKKFPWFQLCYQGVRIDHQMTNALQDETNSLSIAMTTDSSWAWLLGIVALSQSNG